MASGGKRPGSGRRRGTPIKTDRLYFKDHWTEAEKIALVEHSKTLYKGNPKMTVSLIEHIYGRPAQSLSLEGSVDHTVNIHFLIHDGHRYQSTLAAPEAGRNLTESITLQGDGGGEEIREDNVST